MQAPLCLGITARRDLTTCLPAGCSFIVDFELTSYVCRHRTTITDPTKANRLCAGIEPASSRMRDSRSTTFATPQRVTLHISYILSHCLMFDIKCISLIIVQFSWYLRQHFMQPITIFHPHNWAISQPPSPPQCKSHYKVTSLIVITFISESGFRRIPYT